MNQSSTYAFYGSLRRGMVNHEVYKGALKHIFDEVISGYQLYAMEEYPYAVRTDNSLHKLSVEVFQVTDPEVEQQIHLLELEVGYFYDEVTIRGINTGIYLFEKPGREALVRGGDWVKFFRS